MNITQEQKEFIENIIKDAHGYEGNESLLDEFFNEVVRRSSTLISKQNELDNIKFYIKRIANTVIFELIKTSAKPNIIKKTDNKASAPADVLKIGYEFDENGDIALNYDISFEEVSSKKTCLSKIQIKKIEEIVYNLDEENKSDFYENIFKLRYLKGLNNSEIAERLEIKESEVDKKLLFIINKVRKEVFV